MKSEAAGAVAVVVPHSVDKFAADAPLLVVDDVLAGLVDLGARVARATQGAGDRRDRLGRQDLDQGGVAARARAQGETHASSSVVQQSSGACRCRWRADPQATAFAMFEIGMNHAGEIDATESELMRPHVAGHHHGASRCIWNSSPASRRSPTPRRKSSSGWSPAAPWCSTATIRNSRGLQRSAKTLGISAIVSFGADAEPSDARLIDVALHPDRSAVHANILGHRRHLQARHARPPYGDEFAGGAGGGLAGGADLALRRCRCRRSSRRVGMRAGRVLEVGPTARRR